MVNNMAYCDQCGLEIAPGGVFCSGCGKRLGIESTGQQSIGQQDAGYEQAASVGLRYEISPQRILFMTIATSGFYLFYWYYLTWKQYRESSGAEVYPVWHALTLLVPIYNLLRTHAHMRVFPDQMKAAGLATTISVWWAVAAVGAIGVIGLSTIRPSLANEITQGTLLVIVVLEMGIIAIVAWLLLHVQLNLNCYWRHLSEGRLTSARIGVGEVIFAVVGLLSWLETLVTLFS